MTDFRIDTDGNFVKENFQFLIADGADYVRQKIQIKLRFFLNEWYLNINAGIPYFQFTFNQKQPNLNIINDYFKKAILSVEGVKELSTFNATYDAKTRKYSLSFRAILDNEKIIDYEGVI